MGIKIVEDIKAKVGFVEDTKATLFSVNRFTEDAIQPRVLLAGMPMGLLLTLTYPEQINI